MRRLLTQTVLGCLATLAVLAVPDGGDAAARGGRFGVWTPFLGNQISTLAVPDYYANYFSYSFDRTKAATATQPRARDLGLLIAGDFGHARYMSFNIYDGRVGTSLGSLTDIAITPRPGNVNPFDPASDAAATDRRYAVTIVPDTATPPQTPPANQFVFPDGIDLLTVIIRYYVPQGTPTGLVPLPEVLAFDAVRTSTGVATPRNLGGLGTGARAEYRALLAPSFDAAIDDTLRFYRAQGENLFDNADNDYLANAVIRKPNEVLIVKFRPPTFAADTTQNGTADVRYWSVNQCNADSTTPFGMRDEEFTVASDGFVYIAIGPSSVRRLAERGGFNFMQWRVRGRKGLLVYRNLVTRAGFAGDIGSVPALDADPASPTFAADVLDLDARNFIGDHAPTGIKVTKTAFRRDYGGMAPPP